jgi:ABC-type cobalamin/Fe3+-siderophores transport system ATPase subunit
LSDEPFSAIDEPTRIGIQDEVFRVAKMMGTTVVLVTHDAQLLGAGKWQTLRQIRAPYVVVWTTAAEAAPAGLRSLYSRPAETDAHATTSSHGKSALKDRGLRSP